MATNTSQALSVLYSTNVNDGDALGNASFEAGNDVVCYAPAMITTSGFWAGVNPSNTPSPLHPPAVARRPRHSGSRHHPPPLPPAQSHR
ncbi:hypothetical protein HPP92_015445 [Vanilla planifolia]|uniref:Uncharacterized protein n=1 Tax=Vanilla planifolia TaxID=51239 RepID=A0A835UTP6_VANPL|nr:hypothetical protein HPP92_015445 [Vanilla planifolia]